MNPRKMKPLSSGTSAPTRKPKARSEPAAGTSAGTDGSGGESCASAGTAAHTRTHSHAARQALLIAPIVDLPGDVAGSRANAVVLRHHPNGHVVPARCADARWRI